MLNFLAAYLGRDADDRAKGIAFLSRAPEESTPGWKMTLEHRPAAPPSITFDEFVEAVVAGRGDEAIRRIRVAGAIEPHHVLLDESDLKRLCAATSLTRGDSEKEALPVIQFFIERYPSSPGRRACWRKPRLPRAITARLLKSTAESSSGLRTMRAFAPDSSGCASANDLLHKRVGRRFRVAVNY